MLKQYIWRGKQWQFHEGKQPDGAVELKTKATSNKTVEAANKAQRAAKK